MQLKSNVNVYDFVTVMLFGRSNYKIWKDQMLHLLQSHSLLHIIDEEADPPLDEDSSMTKKYVSLVRGWILSTMIDEERHKYRIYQSVQLMWSTIESTFDETEDLKYIEASNVIVSNFVSVKLSDDKNYSIWRAQMLYLLESHSLLHIINDYYTEEDKYDQLVNVWIFCTMNDKLLKEFPAEDSVVDCAKVLWKNLESRFTKGCNSRPEPVVSASTQDLKYTQALNVNIYNFVSVKLSGRNNYRIWKAQMLNLIESQKLFHIIDKEANYKVDKYDNLVKGWIFSTMNEQLLSDLTYTDKLISTEYSAKDVWEKIQSASDRQDAQEVVFGIEFVKVDTKFESDLPESDNTDKKRWYKAVAEGCWRKAKSIFKINKNIAREVTTANDGAILNVVVERESSGTEVVRHTPDIKTESSSTEVKKELYEAAAKGRWRKAKSILRNNENAATEAITANDDTLLHVAVERSQNYFVEELLGFLKNEEDIEKKNKKGRTALHIAAMVGNTQAAQLLVLKRVALLMIEDDDKNTPLHIASQYTNLNTYAYLSRQPFRRSKSDVRTFQSHKASILAAIFSKQYDLVETLLKDLEEKLLNNWVMMAFQNIRQKTIVRGSLLFHPNRCVDDILRVVEICNNMCHSWLSKNSMMLLGKMIATLYLICQLIYLFLLILRLPFSMLYFLLWKIVAFIVSPIKNIEMKKKECKDARKILSLVCNNMRKSNIVHNDSLFEAVRLDKHEVVDEILFTSPAIINCKDEEGYNIIQSSILNRAEKVYNLIYHIIERTKYHREMTDAFKNNLGHLAGRLAPSFVLSRTTGAALQLQRELVWFEEVKKLVLPLQLTKKNIYKQTPEMVFTMEHEDLLRQGEAWIKKTAESCSITVALIVTVVFAAAITVPGGNNQDSGTPLFKNKISFTIFAISNAFSLFTGATSLLLFLSILTARSSEKDFLVSLPRRLILGLLTLFLSTIAMLVAFGAILFLVFCDQRPWMLAPICAFACLPMSIIVTIKLPLLVDVIRSTYSPIFGKKSYLGSCKVIKKNTIFTK
ncbi:hypothetical protein M8C21_018329 [Ambrosia artemisiifolia]|uniref:PGG domain-containing protein n=1 Tax=Ambrosia artemisiifolia TaxID=4212 RepID=A0AAD5GHW0_AMBAR|nr:hypothetical protein M8C21_018329 [Ambrosia artemisiifolia]